MSHKDNVPAHKNCVSMAAIHNSGFQIFGQPPPDLTPIDYLLSPKLKETSPGIHFSDIVKANATVNECLAEQQPELVLQMYLLIHRMS